MSAADKPQLHTWLQTALALELATIPPYLAALLSIKLPGNREAAELIRSVMVEEMLHLALVANVLTATGGSPRFDRTAISTYPLKMTFEGEPFRDRKFDLNLRPFSAEAIDTFLQIELPRQKPRLFEFALKIIVPGLTIGEFYQKILDLLDQLAAADPAALFSGDPAWQVGPDFYWSGGGAIIPVVDLASAKAAITLVMEQGEAAWEPAGTAMTGGEGHFGLSHYYRFKQIAKGRRYLETDSPESDPSGPLIEVDYQAVHPFRPNPAAADFVDDPVLAGLNQDFNNRYTVMLTQLQEAFCGVPATLYTAIMDSMHELTPLAHEMMKRPYPGDLQGRTACPTFEWIQLE